MKGNKLSAAILRVVLAGPAAVIITAADAAQGPAGWQPERNIEVIVGTSPGGAADQTARLIQKILQEMRIANATVANKPGASYAISFAYLNQHAADAHYVAISPINLVTNRITGSHALSYTDVTPLAQLFSDYHVFSVRAESEIKTGKDLIEILRNNPGSLSIAISPSFGSANHFAAGTVLKAAGVDIRKLKVVAFASAGESTTNVLGGHADVLVSATPAIRPLVEAGKMRSIAVTGPRRIGGAFARVPTWREQGVGAVFANWRGVIGPKGLNQVQIAFWDGVFGKMVQAEEWKKALDKNFQESTYMNANDSRRFLEQQSRELRLILTELGLAK